MAAKFDTATYVGDKVTQPWTIPHLAENIPDSQFVFIVRDPREVAASWQKRADDPADAGWPAAQDGFAAVGQWNDALESMLADRRARPGNSVLIDHRRFFGSPTTAPLDDLLRFLRLPPDMPTTAVYEGAVQAYQRTVAPKARDLSLKLHAYVDAQANMAAYLNAVD